LDHLLERQDTDSDRIVVFGRSLGGAVGSALVANNPGKVCFVDALSLRADYFLLEYKSLGLSFKACDKSLIIVRVILYMNRAIVMKLL
jgi:pimeloyl-ACP methyl ester carboxylesterase